MQGLEDEVIEASLCDRHTLTAPHKILFKKNPFLHIRRQPTIYLEILGSSSARAFWSKYVPHCGVGAQEQVPVWKFRFRKLAPLPPEEN